MDDSGISSHELKNMVGEAMHLPQLALVLLSVVYGGKFDNLFAERQPRKKRVMPAKPLLVSAKRQRVAQDCGHAEPSPPRLRLTQTECTRAAWHSAHLWLA